MAHRMDFLDGQTFTQVAVEGIPDLDFISGLEASLHIFPEGVKFIHHRSLVRSEDSTGFRVSDYVDKRVKHPTHPSILSNLTGKTRGVKIHLLVDVASW